MERWPGGLGQPGFPQVPVSMGPVLDPRYAMQMRAPNMNGYPVMPPPMSTPMSGTYPMWDMDIQSQMMMQTMNFDRLMAERQTGLTPNLNTSSASIISQKNDSNRDMIEQHQALEQARLLQRFKELRNWQQQQQEMLMSQQHQQLNLLKKEQERMQSIITKQRDSGGGMVGYSETSTPPRRQLPPGTNISELMNAISQQQQAQLTQSTGALPKPVMYVQPKEDDDEIKTNPDLFSDTNSNRGSQATVEEGMFPIPDSASEASVDVGALNRPTKPIQYQQRFNKHELDAPKKLHRSFAELEADTEFLNLSSQSPTFLDMHNAVQSRPNESKITEEEEDSDHCHRDHRHSEDDSYETEEEEDTEEEQETQIEVDRGMDIDEVPIRPGIEGGKTFEQLLEEQLKAEEQRLKKTNEATESPVTKKKTFLKKGQGIARYEQKPGTRPPRSKKPQTVSKAATQKLTESASSGSLNTKRGGKNTSKPPSKSKSATSLQKPGSQSTQQQKPEPSHKKQSQSTKNQKQDKQDNKDPRPSAAGNAPEKQVKGSSTVNDEIKPRKAESFPDDASFIANMKQRQKESEQDLAELDEFEILEQFADNMSFCSNSSIVTRGLRGLQSDRILPGVGPKNPDVVRPVSPRAALIRKLEQHKEASQKNMPQNKLNLVRHSNKPALLPEFNKNGAETQVEVKHIKRKEAPKSMPIQEEKSASESSDSSESDSDSDSDSSEHRDSGDRTKMNSSHSEMLNSRGNCRFDHMGQLVSSVHEGSKNDSVCSTDKKLVRVLSYTGMTETSVTSGSEQEFETVSDSSSDSETTSDEDFIIEESPTKVFTRKVAGRKDDQTKATHQNGITEKDFLTTNFNTGLITMSSKSPMVISKEKMNPVTVLKEETKFSYHSDTDSIGNKKNSSYSDDNDDDDKSHNKGSQKVMSEKKALHFDDDEEWNDNTPNPKLGKSKLGETEPGHDKTLIEESKKPDKVQAPQEISSDQKDTPPTSKLVTKLFPQLKPVQVKQEEQDLQRVKQASQAGGGEGVQSKVLRDKLIELEREIEKFRSENGHLAKLRTEREEGLAKLKKEIEEFEREKAEELKRFEEFKKEELKKLKHERKMFDKYQKAARAGPDKKEREEIENLRMQLSELQEEMKRKESRWTSNNSRLRDKMEALEAENEELREELKMLEKKRIEWMQKDDKNKSRTSNIISSTPADDRHRSHMTNGEHDYGEQPMNDLSSHSGGLQKSQPAHSKASNIRTSVAHSHSSNSGPPHTSQAPPSTHQPLTTQSTTHGKQSNVNQSTKTSAAVKTNQPAKKGSYNSKPGHVTQVPHCNAKQVKHAGKAGNGSGKVDPKSTLRNSYGEEVPRQELGTMAAPQDVSIYGEPSSEAPVQEQPSVPRKLAAGKYGVDRSVIDKGDHNDYEEVQHSDGKVERTYRSGAREILFSNGTKKEISSDGKSIIVSFFNGDIKQIMPDQRVIYYYAENKTTHTNYPDGLEILQFPNDQTEKLYPDGTKEITFPDQTVKYIFPNGSEESIFPDGTVIRLEKNGDKTMEFPNGQREIHNNEYKRREYPDGTVKTVYPDGRQETRYSNGRLRVKDKDGNIVIDRLC
ncbi:centromere protein J-like [Dreissena polymorpha]|uniref:Centromere protein J n=1 Tax=Dreissena polymorpha TaxID=45954 RepID=A0A9D4S0Z1_DREPO|nr:centromere protein J-like [Dreissena polymorpha]XP_052233441.1 centromere protein J-like [Dreissena polymorpha]KAH3888449.1 hypothetical protein DPMN_012484 [Dreissena polymorpha]